MAAGDGDLAKTVKKPLIATDENSLIFPEFELITEREHYVEERDKKKERPETERLKDYENFLKSAAAASNVALLAQGGGGGGLAANGGGADLDLDELESLSKKLDKDFKQFQRRIGQNPEQILRYQRGADPIFAAPTRPPANLPPCDLCKAPRSFEFQLMPQLLAYLDVDSVEKSIDWATVCVFTCSRSCPTSDGYAPEFVFKQDYAE